MLTTSLQSRWRVVAAVAIFLGLCGCGQATGQQGGGSGTATPATASPSRAAASTSAAATASATSNSTTSAGRSVPVASGPASGSSPCEAGPDSTYVGIVFCDLAAASRFNTSIDHTCWQYMTSWFTPSLPSGEAHARTLACQSAISAYQQFLRAVRVTLAQPRLKQTLPTSDNAAATQLTEAITDDLTASRQALAGITLGGSAGQREFGTAWAEHGRAGQHLLAARDLF